MTGKTVSDQKFLSQIAEIVQADLCKETGFGYDLSYIWSGKSYNPGIEFEMKQDYQGPRIILHRGWLTEGNSLLRFHKISLIGYNFWNTMNGNHETTCGILQCNFDAKKGFNRNFGINWLLETLPDKIQLDNKQAEVPPGRYSFTFLSGQYTTSAANKIWANFYTEAGNFYDRWKFSFSSGPSINLGSSFDIGLFYRFDKVKFPERSMEFANHILRVTGLMTLTTKTSLSSFIQYNSAIDGILTNIRFRNNPREGNDFYIVYDEALNTGRDNSLHLRPFSAGRTVLLKYTYTFRL